ncbi:hypothetical protein AMECASPLE_000150 [Ameca splendens]|uniref:Secreted protein n=1 Tax=Ameca splendens TaxID=208324 RepID=A0ABV0XXY9_9TELE
MRKLFAYLAVLLKKTLHLSRVPQLFAQLYFQEQRRAVRRFMSARADNSSVCVSRCKQSTEAAAEFSKLSVRLKILSQSDFK